MLQRGVKPNVVTFSTIINFATLCSLPHKAVEWFEKMPSFGCEPDDDVSSSVIYAYALTGNVDKALSLYNHAKKEKGHINTLAFSAMIKMYGKSGNNEGCLNIYMKVLGPNLQQSVVCHGESKEALEGQGYIRIDYKQWILLQSAV